MASYKELDAMIPKLKRAAIDAYMCSNNWGGLAGFKIDGDKYTYHHPALGDQGATFGTPTEEVTRPGEDGEGGGDWKMRIPLAFDQEEAGKYSDEFNSVRKKIDGYLNDFTWLPDDADIAPLVEQMRQANRKLSVGAVESGGTVTGGGEIAGNINLIMENSDAMAGGLITAFKADFLAQLSKAVGGNHAISVILGGALASQEEMWKAARQAVADIVKGSTDAFNAAAEGGDVPWDVVLKVTGYAVAGAAIFATGGAATALAVGGLGLTILSESAPKEGTSTEKPAGDYDGVIAAFERDLKKVASDVKSEETTLKNNLTTNMEQVTSDKGSYDLSRPPILDVDDDSDLGKPGEIHIEEVLVDEITGTYMPNISGQLYGAQTNVEGAHSFNGEAWYRASTVGIGAYGPSSELFELWITLRDLLGNLGDEVKYSARTLELAVDDIGQSDTGAKDALEKHAEKVKAGKVGEAGGENDPWDRP